MVRLPMRLSQIVLSVAIAIAIAIATAPSLAQAQAQASSFDGAWKVTLACLPHSGDDDAKGYTHRFPGEVVNGQMRAVHGTEGEPGWQRGKAYKYRVKAQFDTFSGSGERLTGRACHFTFAR